MKKIFFVVSLLMMIGGAASAQEFTARQHRAPQTRARLIVTQPSVDGAAQKAARSKNALQLINPFAPREYGDGRECVYEDENDHLQYRYGHEPRPKGIRLFAFAW